MIMKSLLNVNFLCIIINKIKNKYLVETKRYRIPKFAQATTSLVIIDPLQQLSDIQAQAVNLAKQSAQEFMATGPKYEYSDSKHETELKNMDSFATVAQTETTNNSEMCMNKWILFSVLGTLFILIIIQALIVTKYIFKRIFFSSMKSRLAKEACQTDSKSFHY